MKELNLSVIQITAIILLLLTVGVVIGVNLYPYKYIKLDDVGVVMINKRTQVAVVYDICLGRAVEYNPREKGK